MPARNLVSIHVLPSRYFLPEEKYSSISIGISVRQILTRPYPLASIAIRYKRCRRIKIMNSRVRIIKKDQNSGSQQSLDIGEMKTEQQRNREIVGVVKS